MLNQLKTTVKRLVKASIPERYLMTRDKRAGKTLFLTFDDGPSPGYTDQLLSLLEQYEAKATFFVIGKKLEMHMDLGKQIAEQEHSIGNHSLDHRGFYRLSLAEQIKQAEDTELILNQIRSPGAAKLFRAPQGSWNLPLIYCLSRRSFRCIHWSLDTLDFTDTGAGDIIKKFRENPVQNGEIILFHDDAQVCIDVLSVMLAEWKSQGFKFEALS